MKKGLSVLLIAAALFGFYGGATNLNDVLACKDYFQSASGASDDMQRLEDGLNQLKDNEQAYLDGKVALADGEQALAEGEAKLADGEAQYAQGLKDYAAAPGKLADARKQIAAGEKALAAGEKKLKEGYASYKAAPGKLAAAEKQIAQGEKDLAAGEKKLQEGYASYKAAPAQLAAARKQIAQGEKDLAAGEDAIDGLTQLINGIKQIRSGYNDTWRPGYEALKDGRNQIYKGANPSKQDLIDLAAFLPEDEREAYVVAVKDVAGDDEKQNAGAYKAFIKCTNILAKDLPTIQKNVENMTKLAKAMYAGMNAAENNFEFAKFVSENKANLKQLAPLIAQKSKDLAEQYLAGIDKVANGYESFDQLVEMKGWPTFFASEKGQAAISQAKKGIALTIWQKQNGKSEDEQPTTAEEQQAYATILGNVSDDDAKDYIKNNSAEAKAGVEAAVKAGYDDDEELNAGKPQLIGAVKQVVDTLDPINEKVNGDESKLKNLLLPGLKQFNAAATADKVDALSDGQNTISGGVAQIASAVLGNKTLKEGVKENFGDKAIALLQQYKSASGPLSTNKADFAEFETQMDSNPGIDGFLLKAQKLLTKTKLDGQKSLEEGKAKLAAGKAQYAEGLASYKAAPAQLAQGEKDLAAGKKKLAAGKAQYAQGLKDYKAAPAQLKKGEKDLAAGKAKLADGKAQYAQGLKDYAAAPGKLADARQQLADGYKQLEDGKKQLEDGKQQLATYEDGEQQVRDGLATLVGTQPMGNIQSIADRIGNDTDFDNGDKHLELDEGLSAVQAGKGYAADLTAAVTDEIMGRAVGTGILLGAAVLAVLAAILSFLKKNKGAGVFAILAAVAGCIGAVMGNNAGMTFSSVAGSVAGATPWIAAGILAAVAAVHAVVHFAAKKEA